MKIFQECDEQAFKEQSHTNLTWTMRLSDNSKEVELIPGGSEINLK